MLVLSAAALVLIAGIAGCVCPPCGGSSGASLAWSDADDAAGVSDHPIVLMQTSEGDVWLELDRVKAPASVENFLAHARAGHYDATIFHRVVPGFVAQGGGWTPQLVELAKLDAAEGRKDVPIVNEWQNSLKNDRGTIGMAREEAPDSATREWYINLSDNERLSTAREKTGNAGYAVFGRVVKGMEVIDAIAAIPTEAKQVEGVTDGSMENVPTRPVLIDRMVRVETSRARELRSRERVSGARESAYWP